MLLSEGIFDRRATAIAGKEKMIKYVQTQAKPELTAAAKKFNHAVRDINTHIADKAYQLKWLRVDPKIMKCNFQTHDMIVFDFSDDCGVMPGSIEDSTILKSIGLFMPSWTRVKYEVHYDLDSEKYTVISDKRSETCDAKQLGDILVSFIPTFLKTFHAQSNPVMKELKKYFEFNKKGDVVEATQKSGKQMPLWEYTALDMYGDVIYNVSYDYTARVFKFEYKNRAIKRIKFDSSDEYDRMQRVLKHRDSSNFALANTDAGRIMFFHSNNPDDGVGVNKKAAKRFMKLYSRGKVDYFVCCHPDKLGISGPMLLGDDIYGSVASSLLSPTDDDLTVDIYAAKYVKLTEAMTCYADRERHPIE